MTPGMEPKRLALCVDDFGLHEGVNSAVSALAQRGRVNAVGCLVGAPAWQAGSARLAELERGEIDVGLHLDLSEFGLQPQFRRGLPGLILRAYAGRLDAAALQREIETQLDAFDQALRRPPAYVDGHQHVHQLPRVRELLCAALVRRYPAPRPWLRSTRRAPRHSVARAKARLIEALGAGALARLASRAGIAQNRHLLGVHPFRADAPAYRRMLRQWLAAAGDGDLLMCHPSLPDSSVRDPLLQARGAEWAVLGGAGLETLLADAGIVLAPISRSCVIRA